MGSKSGRWDDTMAYLSLCPLYDGWPSHSYLLSFFSSSSSFSFFFPSFLSSFGWRRRLRLRLHRPEIRGKIALILVMAIGQALLRRRLAFRLEWG